MREAERWPWITNWSRSNGQPPCWATWESS